MTVESEALLNGTEYKHCSTQQSNQRDIFGNL